jgi:hypothetical protein
MPRASWKGFLRLSLVSCPIYLSPAATRTKSIRLHQVWQPKDRRGAPIEDDEEDEQPSRPARGIVKFTICAPRTVASWPEIVGVSKASPDPISRYGCLT